LVISPIAVVDSYTSPYFQPEMPQPPNITKLSKRPQIPETKQIIWTTSLYSAEYIRMGARLSQFASNCPAISVSSEPKKRKPKKPHVTR